MYRLRKEEHEQRLTNAITKTYKESKQLYQEEDQYGRQTNFKKQRNSKPRRNQCRKQLLVHIKGPQG